MKFVKIALSACALYAVFLILTSPVISCTKNKVIHDTTTIRDTTRDTTIIRDTVTDTVGCCNINNGMVAYYTFTNGSLADSSGNGNNIAFSNATKTTDRFGNANGAYLFDGSSSYMTVPNSPSLNPDSAITMMAIVKVNGFYAGQCHENQIFGKGYPDYTNGWYAMRFGDTAECNLPPYTAGEEFGGVYGDDSPQGVCAQAGVSYLTDPVKTGQWYILVYTYSAGVSNYYINGVLKATLVKADGFHANSADLYIGKHEDPPFPYWFNGIIDEIRIYNKALCPTAIQKFNSLGSQSSGF